MSLYRVRCWLDGRNIEVAEDPFVIAAYPGRYKPRVSRVDGPCSLIVWVRSKP